MMRALNKTSSSNWDAFQKILEEMKVQEVDPDIDIFNALISRELRQNELESAFAFYRAVVELSKTTSTSPNASTFAPLFKLLARTYRADPRTARVRARRGPNNVVHPQLFRDMLVFQSRTGFTVTAPFLNIVLRAFIYTHDYAGAYVVLGAFRAFMLQPTRNTYLMVGAWRWGERFMGLTSIHGVKKLKVDDQDFADNILGSACRPEFDVTGHLFAYLREPEVEPVCKVPPWAVIEGEEPLPPEFSSNWSHFDDFCVARLLRLWKPTATLTRPRVLIR
ncbi:hypothetical protein LshimejAT787_0110920 [Lyophyllum shimeji]|uniref:Pentatricopeptide repeat-containing protein n=1 Tax=Lyophyllum shimeji TaxID=47721 RepID=A0A9P3UIC4_LYOSH|nr:hypothetical protein LshimejAT787_0110920 [Lyophyllum shimeji]